MQPHRHFNGIQEWPSRPIIRIGGENGALPRLPKGSPERPRSYTISVVRAPRQRMPRFSEKKWEIGRRCARFDAHTRRPNC